MKSYVLNYQYSKQENNRSYGIFHIGYYDQVREARLLRLQSKYLEPDSSKHQEPSFCSGFSQSSKDLFVFGNDLYAVMHYRSHCCR